MDSFILKKEILENGNNLIKEGNCDSVELVYTFDVGDVKFYMIKYNGEFLQKDLTLVKSMYACFFDGYDKANGYESDLAAQICALCRYQEVTGKDLPQYQE